MKSSKRLIKYTDLRRNLFNFIWISCLGIIATAALLKTSNFLCLNEVTMPLVKIMPLVAVLSGIKYSISLMKLVKNKSAADFVYSLPISKTKYFLSKYLAAACMNLITIIFVGVIGGLLTVNIISWVFIGDIFFVMLESFVTSMLITSVMFLSLSATGKPGTAILLFTGIVIAPMILPITSDLYNFYNVNADKVNLLSLPNLYTLNNAVFLQIERDVIYTGLLKAIIFTFLLSVGYFGIGLCLFSKRDAETTGNYTLNKWINYICMSIIPFYIIYFTIRHSFNYFYREYMGYQVLFRIEIIIGLFAVAFLIMILYDIITQGKLRWKNKAIWVMIVLILISVGTYYIVYQKTFNIKRINIDSDDIEHINLVFHKYASYNSIYSRRLTYGGLIAEDLDIIDEDIFDDIEDFCNNDDIDEQSSNRAYPLIKVTLKNGNHEYISLHNLEMAKKGMSILYYGDELLNKYYLCPPAEIVKNIEIGNVVLDDNQTKDIISTYYKEYNNLDLEEKAYHTQKTNEYAEPERKTHIFADMYCVSREGLDTLIDLFYITKNTPETAEKIFTFANAQYLEAVTNAIIEDSKPHYSQVSITNNGNIIGNVVTKSEEDKKTLEEILKNNDISTPDVTDKIAIIEYWYEWNGFMYNSSAKIYISLTDEELAAICELDEFIYN